jgi:diguanylate cyclase
MTTEGKAAIEKLRVEVSGYQAKLEEAEHIASSDGLTGLRNRLWVEGQIERRMAAGGPLCVAIVDIDDFKRVNDTHGHLDRR